MQSRSRTGGPPESQLEKAPRTCRSRQRTQAGISPNTRGGRHCALAHVYGIAVSEKFFPLHSYSVRRIAALVGLATWPTAMESSRSTNIHCTHTDWVVRRKCQSLVVTGCHLRKTPCQIEFARDASGWAANDALWCLSGQATLPRKSTA